MPPPEQPPPTVPPDVARLIQNVLAELGWSADTAAIANAVQRLNIGLPAEDEFSVVCAWLGKCQLLHKLDQQQVPVASQQTYQVPDLLAKFSTQHGQAPVLIEVKSKQDNILSFRPDYLERLQNYAAMLGLPLLIAWKFHNIWMLFEARHLRKAERNFNIACETALQQNLLGVLAGDVAYKIGAGAGLHLRFRKDKLLESVPSRDGFTEEWQMAVDDVAFTDREGQRRTDLYPEVQTLFWSWDLDQQEEHTGTHLHLRYVAGEEGMQFAHTALVRLLHWELPRGDEIHWRGLLRKEQVTANVSNFTAALKAGLQQKVVSHIFHLSPQAMPAFLPASPPD